MPLTVIHQGKETIVDDDSTALVGSDASSTIRIVRPGISRRHALIKHDGTGWKVEDAGSRNGTFVDGRRITVTAVDSSTTCYLGHPTDGEQLTLVPAEAADTSSASPAAAAASSSASSADAATGAAGSSTEIAPFAPTEAPPASSSAKPSDRTPSDRKAGERGTRTATAGTSARATASAPTRVQSTAPATSQTASPSDVEIAQLTAAIRDQVKSIRSLTWSVWAMIAVTAALIVLTLFVGILSN